MPLYKNTESAVSEENQGKSMMRLKANDSEPNDTRMLVSGCRGVFIQHSTLEVKKCSKHFGNQTKSGNEMIHSFAGTLFRSLLENPTL